MADEKDELPDLNENLPDDDFFGETGESDDLMDVSFGDADEGISAEEDSEASFEEVAGGEDLPVGGNDAEFFLSESGGDVSSELEAEKEPLPGLAEEETMIDDILGDDGTESLPTAAELPEEGTPKKKKTSPLLVLFLLLAAGYGAYAYIIPMYFPELLSSSVPATPVKAPAPKRIAVKPLQKKAVPKPAPVAAPKPVPVEKPKVVAEKAKVVAEKAPEPAKVESMSARPAPPAKEVAKVEASIEQISEKTVSMPAEKTRIARANLPVTGDKGFFVQAGAFIFKSNLKGPVSKIKAAGYTPRVETAYKSIGMHRLTAGKWDSFEEANQVTLDLRGQGYIDAKVLPLKGDSFTVLIGSYYYKHIAVEEEIILDVKGFDTEIVKKPVRMKIYQVLLGPYANAEEAVKVKAVLKGKGLATTVLESK